MSWLDSVRATHPSELPDPELPTRYQGLELEGIQDVAVRGLATDYLKDFWVLAEQGMAPGLFGRAGSYKSFAASIIVERVCQQALVPALYVHAGPELARLERRRFDVATERRLEQLESVPFLVLDDITDVQPGTFALGMLNDLVKMRYANGLPTLYTGNVLFHPTNPTALVDQFGAALARRVLERTKGLLLVLR